MVIFNPMQDLHPSDTYTKKSKSNEKNSSYHPDTDGGRTDGRTDEQGESSVPPQLRCGGIKINKYSSPIYQFYTPTIVQRHKPKSGPRHRGRVVHPRFWFKLCFRFRSVRNSSPRNESSVLKWDHWVSYTLEVLWSVSINLYLWVFAVIYFLKMGSINIIRSEKK